MANEINVSLSLSASKGSIEVTRRSGNLLRDMSGDAYGANVQSIPTTAGGTALATFAAVGTPGLTWFRNLDSTNYVDIGVEDSGTFYPFVKLKAGDCALLRLGTAAPYARANTSAVLLEYIILED